MYMYMYEKNYKANSKLAEVQGLYFLGKKKKRKKKMSEIASYKQRLRAKIFNVSMSPELKISARKLGASGRSNEATICILRA